MATDSEEPFYKKPVVLIIVTVIVVLYLLKVTGVLKLNFQLTKSGQPIVQNNEQTAPQQYIEPTTVPAAPATKGYQSFKYGFSLKYPATWRMDDSGKSGILVAFYSPQDRVGDKFSENANVTVIDLSSKPSLTATELGDLWWQDAQNGFPAGSISLIDNSAGKLAGQDARVVTYKVQSKGMDLRGRATMTLKGGKAYIVTMTAEEPVFDQTLNSTNTIFNSFTLN